MVFDELDRIKIVSHLILNYFWAEENLRCRKKNVGIRRQFNFLHKAKFRKLLELKIETQYEFRVMLIFETTNFSCFQS
jgi:hypothetical protein